MAVLAPWVVLDPLLLGWLREDIGRGDRTTGSIYIDKTGCAEAQWISKARGVMAATGKIPIVSSTIISKVLVKPSHPVP